VDNFLLEVLRSSGIRGMVCSLQTLGMCLRTSAFVCASEKGKPVMRRGVEPRCLLAMRYSQAVEQSSGATRLRSQMEGAEAISHQSQPYETGASPMVGVLLASELIPLLADGPKLERTIYLKETEVQR
jgi:hypothetical protein